MPETFRIGITCYPTLGGSGVVATELGKLLAEKGHEVHFITYSLPFRLGSFYKNIYYHEVENLRLLCVQVSAVRFVVGQQNGTGGADARA